MSPRHSELMAGPARGYEKITSARTNPALLQDVSPTGSSIRPRVFKKSVLGTVYPAFHGGRRGGGRGSPSFPRGDILRVIHGWLVGWSAVAHQLIRSDFSRGNADDDGDGDQRTKKKKQRPEENSLFVQDLPWATGIVKYLKMTKNQMTTPGGFKGYSHCESGGTP